MSRHGRQKQRDESLAVDEANERAISRRLQGWNEIAKRAYALYEARGGEHGHDVDDWLAAESTIQEQRFR